MITEYTLNGKFAVCLFYSKSFLRNTCIQKYFQIALKNNLELEPK